MQLSGRLLAVRQLTESRRKGCIKMAHKHKYEAPNAKWVSFQVNEPMMDDLMSGATTGNQDYDPLGGNGKGNSGYQNP